MFFFNSVDTIDIAETVDKTVGVNFVNILFFIT